MPFGCRLVPTVALAVAFWAELSSCASGASGASVGGSVGMKEVSSTGLLSTSAILVPVGSVEGGLVEDCLDEFGRLNSRSIRQEDKGSSLAQLATTKEMEVQAGR